MITKFNTFDVDELKLVYVTLHGTLRRVPDLIDSKFLEELQSHLHTLAKIDGIETTNHSQWEKWLGKTIL